MPVWAAPPTLLEQRLHHDPSFKVRVQAALTLARTRPPGAVDALLKALQDQHPAVRAAAASSLGSLGDPRARPALQAASLDPDPLVALGATRGLEQLTSAAPPPPAPGPEEEFSMSGPGVASSRSVAERRRIIRRLRKPLHKCLIRQLKRDPDFAGATVDFVIQPDGAVGSVQLRDPEVPEGRLRTCVEKALRSERYGKATGGALRISWPFQVSY